MGYKKTGNPPGRPRKRVLEERPSAPEFVPQSDSGDEQPAKPMTRAREGFRRAFADPADALHRPPRFYSRRATEPGQRPILHPNVIAKSE